MKKYGSFMLITDIDGTLNNDARQISAENRQAVDFFVENGGSFAVATGRTQKTAAPFIEAFKKVNAPCIFYNGAMLYDWESQTVLAVRNVKSDALTNYIRHMMKTVPEVLIQIYTKDSFYLINGSDTMDSNVLREKMHFEYANLDFLLDKEWTKVMLYHTDRALLESCAAKLKDFSLTERTNHFLSSPWYLEIVEKGVSKGSMLDLIREMPKFRGKKIFAAGDFENDIEMLKKADVGIAPKNAEPAAKEAADIVSVDNNHHLMAEIIKNIMPNMQKRI